MRNIKQTDINALYDKPCESEEIRGLLSILIDKQKIQPKTQLFDELHTIN